MYKTLCVLVLLVSPIFVSNSAASDLPSPKIVAKAKLTHQTTPMPGVTILTPTQDGLFRLSIYATITQPDYYSQSFWYISVNWTDDGAYQEASGILYGYPYNGPYYFQWESLGVAGPTMTFEAKSGTPITLTVAQDGPPDNSAYSLYYVVERLE
jgi:hypothetical protein